MNSKFEINMPKNLQNKISSLSLVLQLSGPNLLPMYLKKKKKSLQLLAFQIQKTASHKQHGKKCPKENSSRVESQGSRAVRQNPVFLGLFSRLRLPWRLNKQPPPPQPSQQSSRYLNCSIVPKKQARQAGLTRHLATQAWQAQRHPQAENKRALTFQDPRVGLGDANKSGSPSNGDFFFPFYQSSHPFRALYTHPCFHPLPEKKRNSRGTKAQAKIAILHSNTGTNFTSLKSTPNFSIIFKHRFPNLQWW